jgi:raffinose/stachyose/melibiose transport system permease protein
MWHDSLWWEGFVHIGIIFAVAVTAMWVIPLAAAELLITLSRPRWRLFFRYLLIVPLAFSPVIQVLTWQFIYDPNVGVLNGFLGQIGLEALEKNWLGDPNTALWALIFVNFPWIAGLPFLIFSAGLQNIPGEIFDAAAIDGAGALEAVPRHRPCRCCCVRSSCCSSSPSSSCCSTGSPPTSPPKAGQTTPRRCRF